MDETGLPISAIVAAVVAVLVFLALGPIVTIWSLNALGLAIPYTFGTWFAVSWLGALAMTLSPPGRAK